MPNCEPLPKTLKEANPCDDTNESKDTHINKEEGQYFDLNKFDDVFITYQLNSEEFHSAKIEELTKWKNFGVYTKVDDIGQNRITGRWVSTRKVINDKLVPKARYVVHGFQEISHIQSDSPTTSKECLHIVLAIISRRNWLLNSIDTKGAILYTVE